MAAQIIKFPNSAPEEVVQTRGPGRLPKAIFSLRSLRNKRQWDAYCAETNKVAVAEREQRIRALRLKIETGEEYAAEARRDLAAIEAM